MRLPVALRGYRFAETDLLLDRLTEELRLRDEEIARLTSPAPSPSTEDAVPAFPAAAAATFPAAAPVTAPGTEAESPSLGW